MTTQTFPSIKGAVVLVTGANRGIGAVFVQELLAAGAQRIYAAARNAQPLQQTAQQDPRIVPLQLDVTDDASVAAAARQATDINLLINNAGVAYGGRFLAVQDLNAARNEMEVNYFGVLRVVRAFAPILAANGGGALINVLSILSRVAAPNIGSYSASKAAAFSLTQSLRAELRRQGTLVVGVMPGFVDTDMAAHVSTNKIPPQIVVQAALTALFNGQEDVYPGEAATQLAALLLQDPKAVEHQLAQTLA